MSVELADLNEALLDEATVAVLFADLRAHTEVLDVLLKGAPDRYTDGRVVDLDLAEQLLTRGVVFAVQVRYRFGDAEWRDTLLSQPPHIRLVRMQMPWSTP